MYITNPTNEYLEKVIYFLIQTTRNLHRIYETINNEAKFHSLEWHKLWDYVPWETEVNSELS
jgi:hypothetical protein